jgi:hypothetical protein
MGNQTLCRGIKVGQHWKSTAFLGSTVALLFVDFAEPGRYYKVKCEGSNVPSEVYFYQLNSGDKALLKKFTLVK